MQCKMINEGYLSVGLLLKDFKTWSLRDTFTKNKILRIKTCLVAILIFKVGNFQSEEETASPYVLVQLFTQLKGKNKRKYRKKNARRPTRVRNVICTN